MKKIFILFLLLSLVMLPVFAQQTEKKDVIYLKNGDKYIGGVVLKTDKVVMIQTSDGKRFQFQPAEIKEIKKEEINPNEKSVQSVENSENFAGLFQLSGGFSNIKGAIGSSPGLDLSLAFGAKSIFKKNIFLGIGGGYENIFDTKNNRNLSFLPVFVQMKSVFVEKNISPALNIKLGYAFPLQKSYSGGILLHTSGGISIKTTENSNIFVGLQLQLQQTYGEITETLSQGTFTTNGNGNITNFGITTAFIF